MANPTSSDEPAPKDNPDEETPAVVEASADADPAELTTEQLVESFDQLVTRGREAGLRPIRVLFGTYIQKGVRVVEGLLDGLDDKPRR
mgnify:CR=1 FL=1|jgi:hypothetical protein|tara:strand:+ start:266 stop:529 length:264 start_codon:yes stop_codon:yes gene_type:complete